jgi:hypothetical protein
MARRAQIPDRLVEYNAAMSKVMNEGIVDGQVPETITTVHLKMLDWLVAERIHQIKRGAQ